MVICLLTLCLHLPHHTCMHQVCSTFFFNTKSYSDYLMSFSKISFCAVMESLHFENLHCIEAHVFNVSRQKSLTVNFNVCTWGATYREGLKTEWEGAIKYF